MERRRRRRAHRFSWQTRNPLQTMFQGPHSSSCHHTDHRLFKSKKKGRPVFRNFVFWALPPEFFDTWLRYVSWQGHRSEVIHELHFKYGPHAHLAFQCFHHHLEVFAIVYAHGNGALKSSLYDGAEDWGYTWRRHRAAEGCVGGCARGTVLFKLRWPSKKYGTVFLCPIYFPVCVTNSLYIVHRLLLTGIRAKSPRVDGHELEPNMALSVAISDPGGWRGRADQGAN
ncbi:hypothetical protein B0H14DRAFT_412812 [Mycena olivaceomarginata]|nr:hypothetical protein B0H14DRAFT_412812 [Mycena olivaceomarginata]